MCCPTQDSLHLTARKTGIHNMAKSGRAKGRPQGCPLRSHRLRRLKPLTPTFSPAFHSAMPSMLSCCTSDLNRHFFNVAVMTFGGFAQFFVTWLIQATDSPIAPAFYVMFGAAMGLVAASFLVDRSRELHLPATDAVIEMSGPGEPA